MKTKKMIRLSSKGQIVLPKRFRDKYGLHGGDYLIMEELDDGVLVIEKQPQTRIEALTAELRKEAKARGITRKDVEDAIEEARKRAS